MKPGMGAQADTRGSGSRATRAVLALIMLAYLLAGVQYARFTPPWQAPDEPAHFNYVKYVAEHGALPVLQMGDYPHDYLGQIVSAGFPPDMSIDPIRYEAWQPPLYYLLAAGVYRAAASSQAAALLALRLLSVALGALLIYVAYRAVTALAPGRHWLALGAASFVAALPMHVATTAAVNNDTLAELWVALILWQLFALLRAPGRGLRPWLWLGATLGLAGLTKLNTAIALPLALATLGYAAARSAAPGERGRFALARLGALCLPAALLLLPWLARNATVYGLADPLAFRRHADVVAGQLRTADWIADVGPRHALTDFVTVTFHSFWGQFGWMGVVLDERLYRAFAVLSGLALAGILLRLPTLARTWRRRPPEQRMGLALLAGLAALSVASLIWYNLSFLQRQGRYLFPALIPFAVALAAGWREITRRAWRPLAAGLLAAAAALLAARAALRPGPWDRWTLAGLLAAAGGFALTARLPERWAAWIYVLPYPLLLALDFVCLHAFIVPALA